VLVDTNLKVAQHRDTLRYARVRGGAYLRKLIKFEEGDYVYVRHNKATTLEPKTQPLILRVVGVRPSGVLELSGRCGTVVVKHPSACAPCHLPNIDPTVDTSLAVPIEDLPCSVCGDAGRASHMLLCDGCNSGWHIDCLTPPLSSIPRGDWFCPVCQQEEPELPSNSAAERVAVQPVPAAAPAARSRVMTTKRLEEAAGQYDGSRVVVPVRGKPEGVGGRVRFLGLDAGPACYEVKLDDGTFRVFRPSAIASMLAPAARIAAAKPVTAVSQLPARWSLDTYEHARRCLTSLAPGFWTEGHVIGLVMQADMFANQPATSYQPADMLGCVGTLVRAVAVPRQVVDLWPVDSHAMQAALRSYGISQQPAAATPAAALHPGPYESHRQAKEPWGVVTSPSAYVIDLLLLLIALFSPTVLAVLVPQTYLTHAPSARVTALRRYESAGRLVTIQCPATGAELVGGVWVVIFGTKGDRASMVQGATEDLHAWTAPLVTATPSSPA